MYGANVGRFIRSMKKVSTRQLRRDARAAIDIGMRHRLILLAVLAQSGGEVTVTQGTIDQIGNHIDDCDYAIVPGKHKNEHIVRLVEGHDEQGQAADVAAVVENRPLASPENGKPDAVSEVA